MARRPRRARVSRRQVLTGVHRPEASSFASSSTCRCASQRPRPGLPLLHDRGQPRHRGRSRPDRQGRARARRRAADRVVADAAPCPRASRRAPRSASPARPAARSAARSARTGQAGFGRQLTPGEIVDQVLHWHRAPGSRSVPNWRPGDHRGHYNIVFMGMGEPLNNATRVFEAVPAAERPALRLGIGEGPHRQHLRGVPGSIGISIAELPQVNLARLAPAAEDGLRDELVPINREVAAARGHRGGTALRGADRPARQPRVRDDRRCERHPLAGRCAGGARQGWLSHVNLIPLNPTPGSRWSGSPRHRIEAFAATLRAAGVPVTIRDTRGREIEAACGQLHAQLAGRALPRPAVAIDPAPVGVT